MKEKNIIINGHEAVDLGLSVRWATCNVGAESPKEYGGYYAWGETEEKSDYSLSAYKWCEDSYDNLTKYCTNSRYGRGDNKIVLDPKDDVAHVKWGDGWRMPTLDEIGELVEKCTCEWTTVNGVGGQKVTAPNGNSIFLPATGGRYGSGSAWGGRGSDGLYQSNTLHENCSDEAGFLFTCSATMWNMRSYGSRIYGYAVRPVADKADKFIDKWKGRLQLMVTRRWI